MTYESATAQSTNEDPVPPGSTELSIDADEGLPRLQDKVYIYREEDTERVFTETIQLYNLHLEAWRLRDRDRVFSRETRFADEDPQPIFPKMISVRQSSSRPQFNIMPNGQRVLRLDAHRVQSLCGIQCILSLNEALHTFANRIGRRRCASCEGFHCIPQSLNKKEHSTRTAHQERLKCRKCQSDADACYMREDIDTLRCLVCSLRIYRSIEEECARVMPELSKEEVSTNEEHISLALQRNNDLEYGEIEEEANTDHELDIDGLMSSHDPDEAGLDFKSCHDVPDEEVSGEDQSEIQDPADLRDRINEPAYQLFTSGRTPMRQAMLNQALQELDNPENRMALWAAAGRLLLKSPEHITSEEANAIAQWLSTLVQEDLVLMAGDPESPNPFLATPPVDCFLKTDRLLTPLVQILGEKLRRFRSKEAGCRIVAKDYDLSEEALRHLAQLLGYLPVSPTHTSSSTIPSQVA